MLFKKERLTKARKKYKNKEIILNNEKELENELKDLANNADNLEKKFLKEKNDIEIEIAKRKK